MGVQIILGWDRVNVARQRQQKPRHQTQIQNYEDGKMFDLMLEKRIHHRGAGQPKDGYRAIHILGGVKRRQRSELQIVTGQHKDVGESPQHYQINMIAVVCAPRTVSSEREERRNGSPASRPVEARKQ